MFQILKSDIVTSALLFPIINYRYFEYKFAWCKIGFVSSVENKTIKPICFSPFFLFAMCNFNKLWSNLWQWTFGFSNTQQLSTAKLGDSY